MIGKRATDIDLAKAKNPTAVTAEAGSTVNVTGTHAVAAPPPPGIPKPTAVVITRPSAPALRDEIRVEGAPAVREPDETLAPIGAMPGQRDHDEGVELTP